MHAAAHDFVERTAIQFGPFCSVLEIGARDVNGGIRELFGDCVYEGVDIAPGAGVDFVCDASEFLPTGPYDCVVCCEVFEHTPRWPKIILNAAKVLMPGGLLIVTAAGPGRAPHSAVDGGPLRGDEFYCNVDPAALRVAVEEAGLGVWTCESNVSARDVYLAALREEVDGGAH